MKKKIRKFEVRKIRIGDNEKEVIKMVGLGILVGALVGASLVLPNLPLVLKPILKMRGSKGFKKLLLQLRNKNIIYLGGEKIKLTKKGKELLKEIYLSEIKIRKPKKWDGIWRLVAYDIPEKYKRSRDLFRSVLERNGFYQIQKSLWVNPYECKEEIAVLAKDINITPYVIIVSTNSLPTQKDMEEYFGLTE